LAPDRDTLTLNGSYFRPLGQKTSLSISGGIDAVWRSSLLGLQEVDLTLPATSNFSPFSDDTRLYRSLGFDPLNRDQRDLTAEIAAIVNGTSGNRRWSLSTRYSREETTSETERSIDASLAQSLLDSGDDTFNPFGNLEDVTALNMELATAVTTTFEADALLQSTLFQLPAGAVSTSFRAGYRTQRQSSDLQTSGDTRQIDLSRDDISVRTNLDVPVLSDDSAVGAVSLNASAQAADLSDFGTNTEWGAGLNWRPSRSVRLLASFRREESAPSISQLGAPEIITPAVRTFDFITGQTVFVTTTDGSNPDLRAETRDSFRAALKLEPLRHADLDLLIEYRYRRSKDAVSALPTATAEIRAAFDDRFTVDALGVLTAVDQRPINLARTTNERVRWGLDYSLPLEAPDPPAGANAQRRASSGGPGAETSGRFQRRGGGGRRGRDGGRIQFSFYHSVQLSDTALIAPDVPELDFLKGSASGASGGSPRHIIDARVGYSYQGIGGHVTVNWRSGTNITGSDSENDLHFASLATTNLRLFLDMNPRFSFVRAMPFFRGARLSLEVQNLFDEKLTVTDSAGLTPERYQPDTIDPVGRVVMVRFRKLFR
jgi:hypothetical protein